MNKVQQKIEPIKRTEAQCISVIIPTFMRPERLAETLGVLSRCVPPPSEILVHIDKGDHVSADMLADSFPEVKILKAEVRKGPGGGRNALIRAASNELVVSLDDDSCPLDLDFFSQVERVFSERSDMGVLAMTIIHDDEVTPPQLFETRIVSDFVGCGCAYRRSVFLKTRGYVAVQPAYGVEEADLALQVMNVGYQIVLSKSLRVRHYTDRANQTKTDIVAAHITNTALLAYMRYPARFGLYGLLQYLNRIRYSLGRLHIFGVVKGLVSTPYVLVKHRTKRHPVKGETIRLSRLLRHQGGHNAE